MDFEAKLKAVETAQQELHAAVADERKRLLAARSDIDKQLADLDAMAGTAPAKTGRRQRRPGQRAAVIAAIAKHTDGIARADLLEELGVKGDKSGEGSVSNALAALKKAGTVGYKDGKYLPQ